MLEHRNFKADARQAWLSVLTIFSLGVLGSCSAVPDANTAPMAQATLQAYVFSISLTAAISAPAARLVISRGKWVPLLTREGETGRRIPDGQIDDEEDSD